MSRQVKIRTMTPKQADKLIETAQQVCLRNIVYNETFACVLVARDRHTVTTAKGGRFERNELVIEKYLF